MNKKILRYASCIFVLIPSAAHAASSNTSMPVTADVSGTCSVSTGTVAFGAYDGTSASNVDAQATVSVTCTSGTSFWVGLNAGGGSGATVSTRKMTSGANTLNYSLYQDSSRTTLWGNTQAVDATGSLTAGSSAYSLTVYGRIPGSQNVPAGSYSDSVTVTVNY